MGSRRRPVLLWAGVVLALAGTAASAGAYLLPTDFLLRMLAERRRRMGIRDLAVHLLVSSGPGSGDEARFYLKRSERVRWERTGERPRVRVEDHGRVAVGEERPERLRSGPVDELFGVLMAPEGRNIDQMAGRMQKVLRSAGVDLAVVSLSRRSDRVAYVIGALPWEATRPQLWLDKDTFLPLGWVLRAGEHVHEVRLLRYGSSEAGDWFPHLVERRVDGELVERLEVVRAAINEGLPDTLFLLPDH